MSAYRIYDQNGTKMELLDTVEAGSPEDAGRVYAKKKYEGGQEAVPEEIKVEVVIESAVTSVTVRPKRSNLTFEVESDREVRKRAQVASPEAAGEPANETPQRDVVNA
jgi:hypothetical protein